MRRPPPKLLDANYYRASRVHQLVRTHYLDGGLLARKPLWYDVVVAHPPMPRPTQLAHYDPSRYQSGDGGSGSVAGSSSSGSTSSTSDTTTDSAYCRGLHTNKWIAYGRRGGVRWSRAVHEASKVYAFPRDIVYPEDALRQRFYRDHPWEQLRPTSLVESPIATPVAMASPSRGATTTTTTSTTTTNTTATPPMLRDGEAVVRYARALMEDRGGGNAGGGNSNGKRPPTLTEDEAYRLACAHYERQRTMERREQALAVQRARQHGASRLLFAQSQDESQSESQSADTTPVTTTTVQTTGHSPAWDNSSPIGGNAGGDNSSISSATAREWLRAEDEAILRGIRRRMEMDQAQKERELARRLSTAV